MENLPEYIHENGIDYVLAGDYYIPIPQDAEQGRIYSFF